MAATERFTLISTFKDRPIDPKDIHDLPGLRIVARTTTASLSDYPEWNLDEIRKQTRSPIVTDGACS